MIDVLADQDVHHGKAARVSATLDEQDRRQCQLIIKQEPLVSRRGQRSKPHPSLPDAVTKLLRALRRSSQPQTPVPAQALRFASATTQPGRPAAAQLPVQDARTASAEEPRDSQGAAPATVAAPPRNSRAPAEAADPREAREASGQPGLGPGEKTNGRATGAKATHRRRHWRWPKEWRPQHWHPPQLGNFGLPLSAVWVALAPPGQPTKQRLMTVQQFFNYVEGEGAWQCSSVTIVSTFWELQAVLYEG